jgi:hypothetical protein
MEDLADINWPGLATGYLGYRVVKSMVGSRVGYKRKGSAPVNRQGFRTKIRRKMVPSKPFKMRGNTKFGDSRCIVTLRDIKSHHLAVGVDLNENVTGASVVNAPLFRRYANQYGRFRIKAIKLSFMKDNHMTHLLTSVTQLSETKPSDATGYMRDITCRHHNLNNTNSTPSRTLRVSDVPLFDTFYPTATTAANLPDCAINYLLKHQHLSNSMTLEIKVAYVVEFAYMLKNIPEIDLKDPAVP